MAATIGEQLRIAREERGISLREISDETRISVHYLESIEINDYKRLPGGIFNRSFVKAYARTVGYDPKLAVEGYVSYMREQGEIGDDISFTPYHSKVYTDARATRSPVLTVVLAIVILAILTAVALAVLNWAQRRSALTHEPSAYETLLINDAPVGFGSHTVASDLGDLSDFNVGKADYPQVLQ